jgi:hypothetical protein
MTTDHSGGTEAYEAPTLTEVGSVKDLTAGHLFQPGHDNLSWIPVVGGFFGS